MIPSRKNSSDTIFTAYDLNGIPELSERPF
jgi:hypothetical protein